MGNDFPYPNYLRVLYRIAWEEQKSTYAEIVAASSDASKGCILQGNRSWISQQRTGGAQRYNTEQSWSWQKWKKNEGRWQEKKETGKKTQLNGNMIQNRQDATSWKKIIISLFGVKLAVRQIQLRCRIKGSGCYSWSQTDLGQTNDLIASIPQATLMLSGYTNNLPIVKFSELKIKHSPKLSSGLPVHGLPGAASEHV